MTTYEKELALIVQQKYSNYTSGELIEKLIEMGVVDFSRCKILAVREYVGALGTQGVKKTNAMWQATEKFSCSYEYIRKCMYYYTDVNLS